MPDLDSKTERWIDGTSNSVWERNPLTRVFSLVTFRKQKVDGRWGVGDIAKALDCRVSDSPDDGADVPGFVAFPPEFKYSPNTGRRIDKMGSKTKCGTWLPVCGTENLTTGLLRGGCLTAHPLKLRDACLTRGPDRELPLPGPGYYTFCVGTFALSSSFLLALDSGQGGIHCWMSSIHAWTELTRTSEGPYLGAESFTRGAWSIEARELAGDTVLFWPSDAGLFAIKIDILSLSYEARLLAEGSCLSVPCILRDKVYVLVEKHGGTVHAVSVDADWQSRNSPCELPIDEIPAAEWTMSAVTPHEVIWLSENGQVLLRPNAQQYLFLPWGSGIAPQLRLGGPHCSPDGNLYVQVLHPSLDGGESGYGFVQLARPNSEQRTIPSFCARMLTGRSSIRIERWLKGDPWIEPTVVTTMAHENDEAVIPILESTIDDSLLVLRIDHLQGLTRLFERTGEMIATRFQIMGRDGNDVFYVKRLREPWNTTAFVFDGVLFFYHPDIESLPGWLTEPVSGAERKR